ncbi:MAG: tryptophan 7-halogenase [Verrucomicrobiae bacterium]|nr:tryptophan 7-halogenase [Verrucomicrobiae bacterium]
MPETISDPVAAEPEIWDAVIIGGGPGGATAAFYLAKAGKRVVVIEKEKFPRFHVGESLLPYNMPLFREMDLVPKLKAAGFMEKYGAQFLLPSGDRKAQFAFGAGRFAKEGMSYQVDRARFDEVLLRHAESAGATVREETAVKDYRIEEAKGVSVTVQNGGPPEELRARFLIDASGTANLTGNREGLKEIYEHHRKVAIYGHFSGVPLPEDRTRGDILIYRLEDAWFWFIPISDERASLGLVVDKDQFKASGLSPEELFDTTVARCPILAERMVNAERVSPLRNIADFSYRNRRLVSERLVRIGDAAGFLDPIFSSGVFLAMTTGKMAAEGIAEAIDDGVTMTPALKDYEKRTWRYMRSYFEMIENFYRQPFFELLVQPDTRLKLADAVVALLAGQLEGGWSVWWRLKFFFFLVKVQARFPVVDRFKIE